MCGFDEQNELGFKHKDAMRLQLAKTQISPTKNHVAAHGFFVDNRDPNHVPKIRLILGVKI